MPDKDEAIVEAMARARCEALRIHPDYFGSDKFDPEFLPFAIFDGKSPNAETLAAMQELEDGGTEKFASVDDLMKDLNDDELEGKSDA